MPHDYKFQKEWLRHQLYHIDQTMLVGQHLEGGIVGIVVVVEVDCTAPQAVLRFGVRGRHVLCEYPVDDVHFPLIPSCAIRNIGGALTFVPARFGELGGLPNLKLTCAQYD
jgi:hypothetical protein